MLPRLLLLLAGIVSLGRVPRPVCAQVVRGVVLDSVTRNQMSDAMVVLLDAVAEPVTMVRTNARGRFLLEPSGSCHYALDAASPDPIDHVQVLRAIKAGTLCGGDADAGAVLILTKGHAGGVMRE